MAEFKYAPMFQLGEDQTEYYKVPGSEALVSEGDFEGHKILKVSKEALTVLANTAFRDVSFLLRRSHNLQVAKILSDPEASENDKYVALTFLRNAEVAAKASFLCARIQAPPSSTEKRARGSGQDSVTRRLFHWACSRLIRRRTCVIHRMPLWICTRKSTPSVTFPLRLT